MHTISLNEQEIKEIRALTEAIAARHQSVADEEFLRQATTYAQELPRGLRSALNDFRLSEPSGICVVRGYPVDDLAIGPTPVHWREKPMPSPALREEVLHFLTASLLGDPIAWATQQDGHILHDVVPIRGHEHEQLGSGSEMVLTWHTEDAFHPYRADYLSLMCLRNPDRVETTYACMEAVRLDDETTHVLMQPRFFIRPDESHLEKNRSGLAVEAPPDLLARSYERINHMNVDPTPVPVLFGDPRSPYVRIDPYFMSPLKDEEAAEAFTRLVDAIEAAMAAVALKPGDICFLDNYRAVHGRRAFRARYDGTDRWLKRLNIARSLRASRDARVSAAARVIF